ncbi:MAG: porin [Burkholderiales bacterium]
MKKSLLALAVLGAFAGVASAQSSVTLDGTVDVNARYVKNDGSARRYSLGTDGINSSQFRVSGREDLGGGLWGGFNLNSGLNPDNGTVNARFWHRRATVSLGGNFGEVRLGRDYTPTFSNNSAYDAFGTNGAGDSSHVLQKATATFVRADNSIGYFLPSGIGGVFGQVMVAAAEGGTSATGNPGRYVGLRVGFGAGPFEVAGAYGQQKFVTGAADQKTYNVGGKYDLGVVKLLGYFDRDTQGNDKENRGSFSVVVPIGQSEIHAGYELSKRDNAGVNTKVDQIAVGYVYNLSKRTALYATASRLNNKNGTANSVAGGTSITAAPVPSVAGGSAKSTGAEFGIRHFF